MKKSSLIIVFILFTFSVSAQTETNPYNFEQYQRLNSRIYSTDSRIHTSIKPTMADDSLMIQGLDSIRNITIDTVRFRTLLLRKLFSEHLVEVKKEDFNVFFDYLPDLQIGRDIAHDRNTWLNTRGFQVQGNIGKDFTFYSSLYENQAVFPTYLNNYINSKGIIPGLVNNKFGTRNIKDWAYASALLNYTPNKHFSFTLGQDKNFIGDGYRSMLLSDAATNYPFFKIVTTLGNVKYMNIWAQLIDLNSPVLSYDNGFRKKWGVFHYLDWSVNNRLSIGLFESVIWQGGDETGQRGFDVSYLTPIIFLRAVEGYNGSPDNALLGLNGKYKIGRNITLYGQFLLDEFTAKEFFAHTGYWANKFGVQAGLKSFDIFKIKGFNMLAEFNTARPYTYSSRSSLINYGHYNQALAHPFGANFREVLSIWNYSYRRLQLSLQGNYAQYGLDSSGKNYGKDILLSYNSRVANYGNSIGQGVKTKFAYADARVSYLVNPKNNLRIEAGAVYRNESNSVAPDKTTWITFGLRSSFRNLYQDF